MKESEDTEMRRQNKYEERNKISIESNNGKGGGGGYRKTKELMSENMRFKMSTEYWSRKEESKLDKSE